MRRTDGAEHPSAPASRRLARPDETRAVRGAERARHRTLVPEPLRRLVARRAVLGQRERPALGRRRDAERLLRIDGHVAPLVGRRDDLPLGLADAQRELRERGAVREVERAPRSSSRGRGGTLILSARSSRAGVHRTVPSHSSRSVLGIEGRRAVGDGRRAVERGRRLVRTHARCSSGTSRSGTASLITGEDAAPGGRRVHAESRRDERKLRPVPCLRRRRARRR